MSPVSGHRPVLTSSNPSRRTVVGRPPLCRQPSLVYEQHNPPSPNARSGMWFGSESRASAKVFAHHCERGWISTFRGSQFNNRDESKDRLHGHDEGLGIGLIGSRPSHERRHVPGRDSIRERPRSRWGYQAPRPPRPDSLRRGARATSVSTDTQAAIGEGSTVAVRARRMADSRHEPFRGDSKANSADPVPRSRTRGDPVLTMAPSGRRATSARSARSREVDTSAGRLVAGPSAAVTDGDTVVSDDVSSPGSEHAENRHSSSASIATAFRSFTIDGPFPNPRVILTRPESRHRPASPVGCFTSSTAAVMFAIGAAAYVWTRWRGCLHVARNRVLLGRLSGVGYGSWSGWCWTGPVRKSTNPKGASSPRQRSRMMWPSSASASLRVNIASS